MRRVDYSIGMIITSKMMPCSGETRSPSRVPSQSGFIVVLYSRAAARLFQSSEAVLLKHSQGFWVTRSPGAVEP